MLDSDRFLARAMARRADAVPMAGAALPPTASMVVCTALIRVAVLPGVPRPLVMTRLRLEHRPQPGIDRDALAVLMPDGGTLAYLPRTRAASLMSLLTSGLTAEVRRLDDRPTGDLMVEVRVSMPI